MSWPTDNIDGRTGDSWGTSDSRQRNPYGRCAPTPGNYRSSTNDLACSWQYGWNRAVEAVDDRFGPAARQAGISDRADDYLWWLDVETMNSWQDGSAAALSKNTASIEGMAQFLASEGAAVGLYSTHYQWNLIVGRTLDTPNRQAPTVGAHLTGLPSWLAGARDANDAEARCATAIGLTDGPVMMNQYIADDLDYNYRCG